MGDTRKTMADEKARMLAATGRAEAARAVEGSDEPETAGKAKPASKKK